MDKLEGCSKVFTVIEEQQRQKDKIVQEKKDLEMKQDLIININKLKEQKLYNEAEQNKKNQWM